MCCDVMVYVARVVCGVGLVRRFGLECPSPGIRIQISVY